MKCEKDINDVTFLSESIIKDYMVEITEFVWCEYYINQLLKELKDLFRLCDWSAGTKIVIQFNET